MALIHANHHCHLLWPEMERQQRWQHAPRPPPCKEQVAWLAVLPRSLFPTFHPSTIPPLHSNPCFLSCLSWIKVTNFRSFTHLQPNVPVSEIAFLVPTGTFEQYCDKLWSIDHSTISLRYITILECSESIWLNPGYFLHWWGDLGDLASFLATIWKPSYHCLTSPTPRHTL